MMTNPLNSHYPGMPLYMIAKERIRPYGSKITYTFALEGYPLEKSLLKPIFGGK
jgi:hypothetical protein